MVTKIAPRRKPWLAQRRYSRRRFGSMAAGATLLGVLGAASAQTASAGPDSQGMGQIKHVLVLMQENHSFDSYFGKLGKPGSEAQPSGASNPNPLGGAPIQAFHHTDLCEVADLDHSWNATHQAWNNGAMNGFTAINRDPLDTSGRRAMGYHTGDELPFYYGLYNTFATGDRYFCSLMGPTFPNRYYLLAGTSFGHVNNAIPISDIFGSTPDAYNPPNGTVFEQLDRKGISWKIYYAQVPFGALFGYVRRNLWRVAPMDQYYHDVRFGGLPQVSFIDPGFFGGSAWQTDEHPPVNVQVGQRFVADIINALMYSSHWSSSALFLTYDEHGGYYDHVPPPAAPRPDNIAPIIGPGEYQAAFDRYGIRVPVVVVSPYARKGYVSHVVNDHTSVLKFIETRFGLPSLTARDAAANPMLEFFDFSRAAFARPPLMPGADINIGGYFQCVLQEYTNATGTVDSGFPELQQMWNRLPNR